ncbi:hypothetical protein HDU37_03255 [Klebsiella pneumoniae]|nr:hypothetical protein [Klebsiella pneumoniae]NKE78491.1 hypothetical protein [Klebsiella pneumoniae]HBY3727814.1 hypothetical protein [Klebsiella pneumoniae]
MVRHALVELQERRKADSVPVGWTDEAEMRDVEKSGCGYLFKANPITPHADPRRVILLYRHAQPTLSLTEKIEQPRKKVHRCDVCTEGARVGCGTCIFNGNFE